MSAEASLRAVNADIGVARAAFFPALTLGVDSTIAAGFGNPAATATSMAANLLAPIFSGGRLTGNLENVTARQKELAALYQKTVLTAFGEVEDALAALKSANERVVIARASVIESQNAYDIAKARFDAGAVDYLPKGSLSPERLATALRHALELARAASRTACLQEVTAALTAALTPVDVARVVTWQALGIRAKTRGEWCERVQEIAERLVAPARAAEAT